MRFGWSSFVVVLALAAGCNGDDGGNKKLAALEKRVEALEKEVKGGKGDKDKGDHAKADHDKKGGKGDKDKGELAAGEKGKVDLAGDATKVALLKDGSRFEVPGPVPVGSYEIVARFGEGEENKVKAGTATVAKGQTLTIECTAASKACTTR